MNWEYIISVIICLGLLADYMRQGKNYFDTIAPSRIGKAA
jgi:hypothetical protein